MSTQIHSGPAIARPPAPVTCELTEDARLLNGVRDRAASVLALVAARAWPGPELQTLTRYLQSAALEQCREESSSSCLASERFTRLHTDLDRLSTLTEQLETVEPASCPRPHLRLLVEDLLHVLERPVRPQQPR